MKIGQITIIESKVVDNQVNRVINTLSKYESNNGIRMTDQEVLSFISGMDSQYLR